jgi:hypothetical protein
MVFSLLDHEITLEPTPSEDLGPYCTLQYKKRRQRSDEHALTNAKPAAPIIFNDLNLKAALRAAAADRS